MCDKCGESAECVALSSNGACGGLRGSGMGFEVVGGRLLRVVCCYLCLLFYKN